MTQPQTTDLQAPPAPEAALAAWIADQERSILRQMVTLVSRPGILSLAGGLPNSELFPTAGLAESYARVLHSDSKALQYGPPVEALKQHVVDLMARRGVDCCPEQVFLTTGAQQGLSVLGRLFVDPGATVALEEYVYTGARQAVAPRRPRVLSLPSDLETGLSVDALESALIEGERPALLYVIPDAHNPLGVSLSVEKRERLVELSQSYGIPIVEDDPYGLLWLDREFHPPLSSFGSPWVCSVGSFSKILAPALRLGWLVLPQVWLAKASIIKEALDLECSALTQRVVSDYLDRADMDSRLDTIRAGYRARRDAMVAALEENFGAQSVHPWGQTVCKFSRPEGGMFAWVELPETIDTMKLVETTVADHQVAFIPGVAFAESGERSSSALRFSFSTLSPEQIRHAVAVVAKTASAMV